MIWIMEMMTVVLHGRIWLGLLLMLTTTTTMMMFQS